MAILSDNLFLSAPWCDLQLFNDDEGGDEGTTDVEDEAGTEADADTSVTEADDGGSAGSDVSAGVDVPAKFRNPDGTVDWQKVLKAYRNLERMASRKVIPPDAATQLGLTQPSRQTQQRQDQPQQPTQQQAAQQYAAYAQAHAQQMTSEQQAAYAQGAYVAQQQGADAEAAFYAQFGMTPAQGRLLLMAIQQSVPQTVQTAVEQKFQQLVQDYLTPITEQNRVLREHAHTQRVLSALHEIARQDNTFNPDKNSEDIKAIGEFLKRPENAGLRALAINDPERVLPEIVWPLIAYRRNANRSAQAAAAARVAATAEAEQRHADRAAARSAPQGARNIEHAATKPKIPQVWEDVLNA